MLKRLDVKRLGLNLLWQPLLASVIIAMVLLGFSSQSTTNLVWALGAGAVSSTVYIVFGAPSCNAARMRNIIGGYLVAILCGVTIQHILTYFGFLNLPHLNASLELFGVLNAALVVGLVLLLMSLLQCEHPPAAGLSLVVVIDMRNYKILLIIVAYVCLIAGVKWLLSNYLKDLY